jgi:hypothetical protein
MTFQALHDELDRWSALGERATSWWRDDDACADTPALRRLLSYADSHDVPLGLAVVPAKLADEATRAIAACARCTVMQHGYVHHDHAPAGEKRSELGAHRALPGIADDLSRGREVLEAAFGERFAPVLVPPWNRIAADVVSALPALGYRGLSTFGARRERMPVAGLVQCNAHADVIAWHDGRRFVGDDEAAALLATHLASRREARVDPEEPTGLLTHHLDFDAAAWKFIGRLFAFTREHPALRWVTPAAAFGLEPMAATSVPRA